MVYHVDFGDYPIAQALVYNNTPYAFTGVELVLNPDDGGGYRYRIPSLASGESMRLGQGNFYSSSGRSFPEGAVVVDAKFVGVRDGETVKEPGLVYEP